MKETHQHEPVKLKKIIEKFNTKIDFIRTWNLESQQRYWFQHQYGQQHGYCSESIPLICQLSCSLPPLSQIPVGKTEQSKLLFKIKCVASTEQFVKERVFFRKVRFSFLKMYLIFLFWSRKPQSDECTLINLEMYGHMRWMKARLPSIKSNHL